MSLPTAELTVSVAPTPRTASSGGLRWRVAGGRLYVALGLLALVLAGFSLLIPSTPSYDPWAWLVWGREIVHLNLHLTGGPTWKPLPVVFTTLFAPFGKAAPDMWLVLARAGALMAVAMVFRVTTRFTRPLAGRSLAPTLLAGVIAAGSLVVSRGFISDNAYGYSEGLMTALVLIAFERHLDGARRQAFTVGFVAALDRPELWLAWGPYGLYLWWKDPGARKLVVALFALLPVLWFGPQLWGSGSLFSGVARAQHPRSNSPAFAKCPFCTELLKHAWPGVLLRVKAAAGIAIVVAAFGLWRARGSWLHGGLRATVHSGFQTDSQRAGAGLIVAGLAGLGWWVLIGILTQAGFSGNDRYLVLGAALVAISGGVGWGWAAHALARALGRLRTAPGLAGAAGALAAAAVFMALPPWIGANVVDVPATHRAIVYQAHLREDASASVRRLGGPANVLRCGTVMTEGFQVPMLAWTLGVHTLQVQASPLPGAPLPPAPNVIFQTRAQHNAHLLPVVRAWTGVRYRLAADIRAFRVFEHCRS